jgi:hypothetical protein
MGDLWFYESIMVFRINPIGSTTFYKRSFVQQAAERSTWNIALGSIKSLACGFVSPFPQASFLAHGLLRMGGLV